MILKWGYRVMRLNTGKPPTLQNNMINELSLSENVIDIMEQLAEQEGATEYLELNDQHDNKIEEDKITGVQHEIVGV